MRPSSSREGRGVDHGVPSGGVRYAGEPSGDDSADEKCGEAARERGAHQGRLPPVGSGSESRRLIVSIESTSGAMSPAAGSAQAMTEHATTEVGATRLCTVGVAEDSCSGRQWDMLRPDDEEVEGEMPR